jgi:hypothetical protein
MKTQKTVMSKIAQINKEELSKVELSLVDDLKKEFGKLQTLGLDSDLLSFESKYEKKIPQYKSLKSKFDDAFQKAKELGVDKLASEAKQFSGGCDESIKKIQKKVNLIKQIVRI